MVGRTFFGFLRTLANRQRRRRRCMLSVRQTQTGNSRRAHRRGVARGAVPRRILRSRRHDRKPLVLCFFAGIFALMMRFGCGAHVMGHRGKHDASSNESGGASAISPNQPIQSTDPVCEMSVDIARAKSAVHDGHAYYFCSKEWREIRSRARQLYQSRNHPSTVAKGASWSTLLKVSN